jgi:hypothetical protein
MVLSEHPDGVHVACMAIASPYNRGAVWNRATGEVVWAPPVTQSLCWLPGGREIVLVRDGDAAPFDESAAVGWPARGPSPAWRRSFLVERRTWPQRAFVNVCPVDSEDANWNGGVVASPRGDLVAVVWFEQHVAGFELVAIRPGGDRQVAGGGYAVEPNCISAPVFSPDGRFLVLGCGRFAWWNDGDEYGDDNLERPSPGGLYRLGHLLVRDLDAGTQRELPVEDDVPAGWLPPEPSDGDAETSIDQPIGAPQFDSPTSGWVPLLTGTRRRFSATEG